MYKILSPLQLQLPDLSTHRPNVVRAAVISGGGAFGAAGAGTLSALNKQYDIVAGVSTGSLMAPLVALNAYDRLRIAYTSVGQNDIFTYNPFKLNGKINVWKAIYRILRGKKTLGESLALRQTIDKFLTAEDLAQITALGKQVIVACQETSREPETVHYFSSKDCLEADFKDWMWASANAPAVTSILYKNGGEWTDAGVTELLSLKEVIEMGATEIDVIIHRTRRSEVQKSGVKDLFNNAFRLVDIMRHEIEHNDLETGLLYAQLHKCNVNVYWLPEKLGSNSLIFNKDQMNAWWQLGFNTAFEEKRIDRYVFNKQPIEAN